MTAAPVPAALAAEDLRKSFGALEATGGVSLALPPGRRHAVIGPNGAGKTTLFNLLSGALRPDGGRVRLGAADVTAEGPDARARRGLARSFQRNSLFPGMTVEAALMTAAAIAGGRSAVFWRRFDRERGLAGEATAIAERIGLADQLGQVAGSLAYGAQRQLEIGLALATRPSVLLLDEPTAGMSPEETRAMQRLLAGLPAAMTILVIEHDMDVVFDLADRVTVLDHGAVLLEGTPDEIRGSDLVRRRYLGERTG
ncbi:amino acid/amide ABC transporter ATP-binding protein 1 (HAAT family) [Stella humosa]|uniref:Amino acid/amide ABC transporter ATP-binding protein 1 (HAAT family) n=1 Tax=Stella humosa TaxID=94 RepID=A0A3N1KNI5_9PROT|nr:ABC transporter ATP-binding protein [Stella humosa]ROP83283.1 amino acid/amide ABC transporter ATP-binding protein 1 (HAAT family) [Stella humosa]BBK29934.1 ABC transporter ATP-binding protein [Stella humosa]